MNDDRAAIRRELIEELLVDVHEQLPTLLQLGTFWASRDQLDALLREKVGR